MNTNPNYTENKIKIDKMKRSIIQELAKITKSDMKDRAPVKKFFEMIKIT